MPECEPFSADELKLISEVDTTATGFRSIEAAKRPAQDLVELISRAKPRRAESEAAAGAIRSRQAGAIADIVSKPEGRVTRAKALGQLEGELPKTVFDPPANVMTDVDQDIMFNAIWEGTSQQPFTKLNTSTALSKALLGELPQRAEIRLLEDIFGEDLARALLAHDPPSFNQRVLNLTGDVINLPRSVMSAWDMSAPLRQGLITTVAHPKESIPAMRTMFRSFFDEDFARFIDDAIDEGPYAELKQQSGLFRARRTGAVVELGEREEVFQSSLAQKIPLIKNSERAYVTYLNKIRSDVFDTVARGWEGQGKTLDDYKALSSFLNHATGRGDLPSFLRSSAPILNGAFFSPRLLMARFQVPLDLFTSTPAVRMLVARDLTINVSLGLGILSLLKLSGAADVELDPRSSDFGKMRFGDQRIDFWGGFQPIARYTAQIMTAQTKTQYGQMFEADRFDLFKRFLRSKLAPVPGLALDIAKGETFLGEELTTEASSIRDQLFNRLTPLFIQDLIESAQREGPVGFARALPAGLGVNVQAYNNPLADAFDQKYPKLAPYNPEAHRAIADMDEDLRQHIRESESAEKLDEIAADFAESMREPIKGVREGRQNAGVVLIEEFGDFTRVMVGAVASEFFGTNFPSPITDEGKILAEFYDFQPHQFRDEFFEIDWSAFNAARDATLTRLPQAVQDALAQRLKLPEEFADVERQLLAAKDANNTLRDIPKYRGISIEEHQDVLKLRAAAQFWRDANRRANGTLPSISQGLSRVGKDFTPRILSLARQLQRTSFAQARVTKEYLQHLKDNQDVLEPFYPSLYPQYVRDRIRRLR